jgi:hypothetical protein
MNYESMTTDELINLNGTYAVRTAQAKLAMNTVSNTIGTDNAAYTALREQWESIDNERHTVAILCGQRMMREQMEHISKEEWSSIVD